MLKSHFGLVCTPCMTPPPGPISSSVPLKVGTPPQKSKPPEEATWSGSEHSTTGGIQAGVENFFMVCKKGRQEKPLRVSGQALPFGHCLAPSPSLAYAQTPPYLGSIHLSSPRSCWPHHTFGLSRSRKTGLHSGPRGSWGGSGAYPLQWDR